MIDTPQHGLLLKLKKALDRIGAAMGLLVLSPLVVIIALLGWITLGRPLLFCQRRPGYKGRPFEILKFRTMTSEYDRSGRLLPDAQRLTSFGRFLRSTSLDELPELWNVLRGDLSLVGPRPLLMKYLPRYSLEQARRHDVLPGITGWEQINGRNDLPWEQKLALDVWYVDHWSLALDVGILFKTVWRVLRRDGISLSGHVTTVEFMGTEKVRVSSRRGK